MADAPISRQFALSGRSQERRAINSEYYDELIHEDLQGIAAGQRAQLRAQAEAAALYLRGMSEIAHRQDAKYDLLQGVAQDMTALLAEASHMVEQLDRIDDTLERGFASVKSSLQVGFSTVAGVLERAVAVLHQQQQTLTEIASTLERPGDTEAQELLCEAQKWLKMGADSSGAECEIYWNDAMGLLRDVVAHKMGRQNFLAWFRIGFIQWKQAEAVADAEKQREAFAEAEKAFFNAQLYSAPSRDLWHTKSLRHLAEIKADLKKLTLAPTAPSRSNANTKRSTTQLGTRPRPRGKRRWSPCSTSVLSCDRLPL